MRNLIATITVPIDSAALQAEIAADPARHRERAISEQIFVQEYVATAARQVTQAALQRAAEAPDLVEFRARLTTALTEPGMTPDALKQRVSASLQKPLDVARIAVAKEQLHRILPALVDRSWVPSEAVLIKVFVKRDTDPHQFDTVMGIEGVDKGGSPMGRESLLRETEQVATQAAGALLEQGTRAWAKGSSTTPCNGQNALISGSRTFNGFCDGCSLLPV
jgi:hypothetical protein